MQNKYFFLLMAFLVTIGVLSWYINGKKVEPVITELSVSEKRVRNAYVCGFVDGAREMIILRSKGISGDNLKDSIYNKLKIDSLNFFKP